VWISCTQRIPQKVLTLSRIVEECKPLPRGPPQVAARAPKPASEISSGCSAVAVAGPPPVGTYGYCSPRHGMSLYSGNEGSKSVQIGCRFTKENDVSKCVRRRGKHHPSVPMRRRRVGVTHAGSRCAVLSVRRRRAGAYTRPLLSST
jgi:hypothetical protein